MLLNSILTTLQEIAPLDLAESWDNVGLLVGRRDAEVSCAMTCLTLTEATLQEAIEAKANLIVAHHPIPFKPISKITDDTTSGSLLLKAMQADIAIYSPHTAWDNCARGINQQIAEELQLTNIKPLQQANSPKYKDECVGTGRYGTLDPATIGDVLEKLGTALPIEQPRHTHTLSKTISKIGIVCGSGGSMLGLVASRGCDAMLTGEATYHQCLEAEAQGIALIMIGHHASEAFAMKRLASMLQSSTPSIRVFASANEHSLF